MKRLLCVLMVLLIAVSLCSCGKSTKVDSVTSDSASSVTVVKEKSEADVKKQSEPSDENAEKKEEPSVKYEEISLAEFEGFYISKKFVDTYKETKSQLEASKDRTCLIISDDEHGFNAMMGDLHQGGPSFAGVETITNENGKYILKTLPTSDEYTGVLELVCIPGNNVAQVKAVGNSVWDVYYSDDTPREFYKYVDMEELSTDITETMLEGINNVEFKDGEAYIKADGAEYVIVFALDSVITEPIDYMETCDGYLYINPVGSQDVKVGQYIYDDGKFTVASEGINFVLC